ncbi:MAG: hypothetical protein HOP18_01080 [Deltaproteobacteria bacterium]|nr:hypothetical protein [Deltaproteobacteria bacterium]
MRKLTKTTIARLRAETNRPEQWAPVEGFTGLVRPKAIRLTPTLAERLHTLAVFHGVGSAEELAKRWLAERVNYELSSF